MQWAMLSAAFAAGTVTAYLILCAVGGSPETEGFIRTVILFDALVLVLNILGQVLMSLAFMEQWVLWIITNVLSVVMWSILSLRGEAHAGLMVIMWVFYLLNSINGLRVWLKISRKY